MERKVEFEVLTSRLPVSVAARAASAMLPAQVGQVMKTVSPASAVGDPIVTYTIKLLGNRPGRNECDELQR